MPSFLFSRKFWMIAGIAFFLLFPLAGANEFALHLSTLILLWAMLCVSLNLIFGYAGQLSLAQGGLFGTGAYVTGVLSAKLGVNFWLAFALGGFAAGLIGILIGVPSLKLRGPYFVIVTLGFNIILVAIIENMGGLTGGVIGLMGIPPPSEIWTPLGTLSFKSKFTQYYLGFFFLLLFWFILHRVKNAPMGRCLSAIKQDEDLCRSVGINTMWMKVQTFGLSSILAGIGGGLYGAFLGIITPRDASFHVGFDALVFLTVGGIGTIAGTIIGPLVMVIISEVLQAFVEVGLLVNGLALILLIIFMPKGIAGVCGYIQRRHQRGAARNP